VSVNVGAEIREHLILERQRRHVLAGRLPAFDPYRNALVSGRAVQFTADDGSLRVLSEDNAVREWAPADAVLPGADSGELL
jgi:hypothetical protein